MQYSRDSNKPHAKLEAWKEARRLVFEIYQLTKLFPRDELLGLTSQLRRAAVSILSNIAEGAGRSSVREFAQFLSVAIGSLSEVDAQLCIATDLGYLDSNHHVFEQLEHTSKLVIGLRRKVVHG